MGPRTSFDVSGKTSLLALRVHEILCFMTNCNWGMKFGPSVRQAARRIYRSDGKEVNGERRKLRSEELHNCALQEFN